MSESSGESTRPGTEATALLDRYVEEVERAARASTEQAMRFEAQERARLEAAFSGGSPLETVVAVEVWDAAEGRTVRVPPDTLLVVAEDEGDLVLGRLTDNSHSLGVVYEEAQRWSARKYFLPLATLCNASRIRILDPTRPEVRARMPAWAAARTVARGRETTGRESGAAENLSRLEALADRDEQAVFPRGTKLVLTRGAAARDAETGETVQLPPGTEATLTVAAGDFRGDGASAAPEVAIEVGGRALRLAFEVLVGLDPGREVLTPTRQRQLEAEGVARREALRRMVGFGLGAACLLVDGGLWAVGRSRASADTPESQRWLLSALVPQVALIHGYFSAGGRYWYELNGRLMDLKSSDCLPATRRVESVLGRIGEASSRAFAAYERAFHRSVHVGWREVKQYETDSKGHRRPIASHWEREYRTVWCEPPALRGLHRELQGAAVGNAARAERARRLTQERLFQLLETPPEQAERDFALHRHSVGFGRDAAISALVGALCVLPAAFMDDLLGFARGERRARTGFVPYQQNVLTLAGAVGGLVLAERHRARAQVELSQNKYALGRALETQLARLPDLPFDAAWLEHFGEPGARGLPAHLRAQVDDARRVEAGAESFRYVHGTGSDAGRPLESIHVDAAPAREAYGRLAGTLPALLAELEALLGSAEVTERLTPVLRNALGTDLLDAQMRADEGEATGGALTQSLWFAAPVWGGALLDAASKLGR
jgi:hypothetical protein